MNNKNDISIQELKKGNHKTFEIIFKKLYNKIYNYASEFVIDQEIAKEITQITFITLWENRKSLRDDTKISALLFTITRNNSLNYLKQLNVRKKHNGVIQNKLQQNQLNYLALKDEISDKVIYYELEEKIEKSIESLPAKCKEIFILSRIEGLKHKEIAQSLNIAIKTVENQIREALKRIRKDLESFL